MRSEPRNARIPVWALSISLAATLEIDIFSFFSSGYLDVSVHRVPSAYLWIQYTVTEVCSAGFPHSEIRGSKDICSSPQLIAAYHVFLRLLVPRHPPCALFSLTNDQIVSHSIPSHLAWCYYWLDLLLLLVYTDLVIANLLSISSDVLLYLIFANFDTLRFYSIFGFQGTNFQELLPVWLNFLSVIRNHKLLCLYTVHLYFLITGKNQHLYESVHSFQSFQRFSFWESGSHLLSHTVSSIVPSAA